MPLALAITHPRLECCTIKMVVPIGGYDPPLLGWAWAVCLDDELEDVAFPLAVDLGDDELVDVADPELADDEAVLWVAAPEAVLVEVEVEPDDPPHAVSSSTSEPSPVATVHPLLRITFLSPSSVSARERDVAL
jgi:hypothetical protein